MADELRKAARETTAVGHSYEKTVKVDAMKNQLLDDLDTFVKRIDEEQQAAQRTAEADRKRRAEELARRTAEEQRKRAALEATRNGMQAAAATTTTTMRRPSALEALRQQAGVKQQQQQRDDPMVARAKAIDALDGEMRAAAQYLGQFAAEVNEVKPQTSQPYDVLYIGRLSVALSDAWAESRPKRVQGRECCEQVYLRLRVSPVQPTRVSIFGADIARCEQLLKSLGADYAVQIEAKTDFGEARRAAFTVKGKLLCEIDMHADYESLVVAVDLTNVRRPGKRQLRIPAAKFKDVGDDLARYILGTDNDFERLAAA